MTSLEDDVRNGWLGLRQNVERVPIRAYEKKKNCTIVPGLGISWLLLLFPRQTADAYPGTQLREPSSARHGTLMNHHAGGMQRNMACKTHASLPAQMHLACSSEQYGGFDGV